MGKTKKENLCRKRAPDKTKTALEIAMEKAGISPSDFAGDDAAHSVSPNRGSMSETTDRDYLAAVKRGDMETAQRMVDEAAKAAGYTVQT